MKNNNDFHIYLSVIFANNGVNTTNDETLDLAVPLTNDAPKIIKGVSFFGLVDWNIKKEHPGYSKWDSHYDTKTYRRSFDWLRDLENISTKFDHFSRLFSWTRRLGLYQLLQIDQRLKY